MPDYPDKRLEFFDHLRYLMVLLVLVFHSAASYTSIVGFWPYHDPQPSTLLEIPVILMDVFMMSVLFFIAGYFTLPSLRSRGSKGFLLEKFRRLGVPWLVVVTLLLPLLDYLFYQNNAVSGGQAVRGYAVHWWLSMRKLLELYSGRLDMSTYLDMSVQFYQRYMWFVSLLLLFYLLTWALYKIEAVRTRMGKFLVLRIPLQKYEVRVALAATALISISAFVLVKILFSTPADPMDLVWFSLGNLLQFQMAKLAFYLPSFGLGIYAYIRGWFNPKPDLGKPWIWGTCTLVMMGVNLFIARSIIHSLNPPAILQVAFLLVYPVWTMGFVGFCLAWASQHWNKTSRLDAELSAHSFNMYLAHYPFPMVLPLLLSFWIGGPALVKFSLVAGVTILLSYLISRFILQKHARWAVLGLLLLNAVVAATTLG